MQKCHKKSHNSLREHTDLLVLMNMAEFFILWKESSANIPLVSGVKEQQSTTKSDSASRVGKGTLEKKKMNTETLNLKIYLFPRNKIKSINQLTMPVNQHSNTATTQYIGHQQNPTTWIPKQGKCRLFTK